MKTETKTSYFIIAGAIAFSACTQEEAPETVHDGSDRRIAFHTSLPVLTTKASEIVNALNKFNLTVYDETDSKLIDGVILKEYYNNIEIGIDESSNSVRSDNCIWPVQGQENDILHFFSFYPDLNGHGTLFNATSVENNEVRSIGYMVKDFKVGPDIADHIDFVTATAKGSMADNLFSGIDLDFEHRLSRIEVKAWGANRSCNIEIAGVRLGGVNVKGDFDFNPSGDSNYWTGMERGIVEYVFHQGNEIITLSRENGSHSSLNDAVSIIGPSIGSDDNCAMVIPTTDTTGWEFATDSRNMTGGMYLSVLLRVIDNTPTSGKGEQRYPYNDNSQGLNAMNIPRICLAVDNNGVVIENLGELYKDEAGKYYTDASKTAEYFIPQGSTVKEFGWASLPISAAWEPGKIYTYTLDYTYGVGLHGPEVDGDITPKAGDPIISDRVGVTLGFKDWQSGGSTGVDVPGN